MKLTINGVRFPWPTSGLHLVAETVPEGEDVGPVSFTARGGPIRIALDSNDAAVTFNGEEPAAWVLASVKGSLPRTGREQAILELISRYGGIDGAHHKQWLLDQIVRILTGDGYAAWIATYCAGEYGPDSYAWDVGIPP